MLRARLFDLQRGSMVDGPGIRTVCFFCGCTLRCAWCHNPESIPRIPPPAFPAREYTVGELLSAVMEDMPFYPPDGGVTCSGGECLLWWEFLAEFLGECRRAGIHTAVDTAGNVPTEHLLAVLPHTDLFLYDIKCASPELHRAYTGAGNSLILENLGVLLSHGAAVQVRIPLIPECNGTREEMQALGRLLRPYAPSDVTLLPYHTLGHGKYRRMGLPPPAFTVPDEETVSRLHTYFTEAYGG